MRALAASVPQPTIGWGLLVSEATRSFAQGDLQASERWAIMAADAGTAAGEPDAVMAFGVQVFSVRYFQGRLEELVEWSAQLAGAEESFVAHRAGAALASIESGREDQVRELLIAEDLQGIRWDQDGPRR